MLFELFISLLILWIIVLLLQHIMCIFLWLFLRFYISLLQFYYDVLPGYAFLCCFLPARGLFSILKLSKYQPIQDIWNIFSHNLFKRFFFTPLFLSGTSITYMSNDLILSFSSWFSLQFFFFKVKAGLFRCFSFFKKCLFSV